MIAWLVFLGALSIIFFGEELVSTPFQKRMVSLVAVGLGATMVVTLGLRLTPGDPIDYILGEQSQESSRELLARDLGIVDEHGVKVSFVGQYAHFLGAIFTNDLKSYVTRRGTLETVFERFPYTLVLALGAMAIALMLGPGMGVLASFFQRRWPDYVFSIFALMGISIPSFFLAPLLILFFSIYLGILPISGADTFRSLILPACSMGLALAAMLARMARASMLEVLSEDYIRTAYAKGLNPAYVFGKHALRNALIPVTTVAGLQFGAVLAGTVVTEKIFTWPGIGLLLLEAIRQLDMPLVQTCVVVIAIMYSVVNLLTDMVYSFIDPRMSARGSLL